MFYNFGLKMVMVRGIWFNAGYRFYLSKTLVPKET